MRWKAYFFLNPSKKPKPKNNYNFKSTEPAPHVPELKHFEAKFADLIKNIKFGRRPNHFQQQLKKDEQILGFLSKLINQTTIIKWKEMHTSL